MSLFQSLAVRSAQNGNRFASGTLTPAAATEDVVTGLRTVEHGGASLAAVGTVNHLNVSAFPSSTVGSLTLRCQKPTSSSNPTPVDATTIVEVSWWAIGT